LSTHVCDVWKILQNDLLTGIVKKLCYICFSPARASPFSPICMLTCMRSAVLLNTCIQRANAYDSSESFIDDEEYNSESSAESSNNEEEVTVLDSEEDWKPRRHTRRSAAAAAAKKKSVSCCLIRCWKWV
jgi:hypothetical protein